MPQRDGGNLIKRTRTNMTDDMKPPPDLTCLTGSCKQCIDLKCSAPDPEVATGNEDKGLEPCPDRSV